MLYNGKAVNAIVRFSIKWTREERNVLKLSSLSTDEIPKSVFSYYTKWSDFIVRYASIRYCFQFSFSDITVQHLAEYFAHRGGRGNLGKKRYAETRAKMTGKEHSAETRAKISKANLGKKRTADHRAKTSKANLGKKRTAESCVKMSMAVMCKKHTAERCAIALARSARCSPPRA